MNNEHPVNPPAYPPHEIPDEPVQIGPLDV